MVILEYEHSYEMKFNKQPKLVKKVDNTAAYEQLKKAAIKQKQINASINKNEETPSKLPPNKRMISLTQQTLRKKIQFPKKEKRKMKKI